MLWGRGRTSIAGYKIEDLGNAIEDTMLFCQRTTLGQRDPCALIFPISALNLLMHTFLNLTFQNSGSSRFVEACDFQDVGGIDPVVGSPSHDMVGANFELVDGYLRAMLE